MIEKALKKDFSLKENWQGKIYNANLKLKTVLIITGAYRKNLSKLEKLKNVEFNSKPSFKDLNKNYHETQKNQADKSSSLKCLIYNKEIDNNINKINNAVLRQINHVNSNFYYPSSLGLTKENRKIEEQSNKIFTNFDNDNNNENPPFL